MLSELCERDDGVEGLASDAVRSGDPDVRFEVCFTVFRGGPGRVEELRLRSQRIDDAQRFAETELLLFAPVLILILREQVPSLAEQRGGGVGGHGVSVASGWDVTDARQSLAGWSG